MKNSEIFAEKLYECEQHKKKISVATNKLAHIMPLDIQSYQDLTDEQLSFIDQVIFRFSKLQDTMGEKLFPAILLQLGEEVKSKSFIDRLNRLEELGLVSKDRWLELRKIRNDVAHEYSNNKEEVVDSINMIFEHTPSLISCYDKIYGFCIEDTKKL